MNQNIIRQDQENVNADRFWLKLLLWLFVIVIASMIVCIILAIVKAAADALFIIGGVCLVIALLCMWGYSSMRLRIHRAELRHQQRNNPPQP